MEAEPMSSKTRMATTALDQQVAGQMAELFSALSDSSRIRIVAALSHAFLGS
jgi:hypothetical protein